jgi:hypothetical protein
LSKIDEDLRNCRGASPSASLLERSKLTAYASLRERLTARAILSTRKNIAGPGGFFSSGAPGSGLYCERCEWDQTAVSTGSLQIRQYFRAMDAAFFDRKSLRILSGW